ncbi:hypothetical protein HWC21_gp044 [Vibrio phage VAP7]|uniref:Uncharacterized protein n=1 Tax=Vibrio phage VAP7 TaxID=2584487 RepID=A0A4Y5TX59_9CAUD|nr:hypothetical protein HWC21_gp044 [Vibrio phage VAP7]QDB73226.1 hypothetical protein [Vibrio phage VAP7]UFD98089.1 hypothetical protein [Vibrio phage BX-1]
MTKHYDAFLDQLRTFEEETKELTYVLALEEGPELRTVSVRKCNVEHCIAKHMDTAGLIFTGGYTNAYYEHGNLPIYTLGDQESNPHVLRLLEQTTGVDLLRVKDGDIITVRAEHLALPKRALGEMMEVLVHNIAKGTGVRRFTLIIVTGTAVVSHAYEAESETVSDKEDDINAQYAVLLSAGYQDVSHHSDSVWRVASNERRVRGNDDAEFNYVGMIGGQDLIHVEMKK